MQNAVEKREITRLVHFTRAENLQSIITHGILPVDTLVNKGMTYLYNDQYRFDNCTNASCLSIQFPNYKMFYSCRSNDRNVDWVVLGLRKEILWEKNCVFCASNAASSTETSKTLDERQGVDAFNRLYDEFPGKPSRNELGIGEAFPTNPQAEILVFERIEPEYIWGVAFENNNAKNKYSSLLPEHIKPHVAESMFRYRKDFENW